MRHFPPFKHYKIYSNVFSLTTVNELGYGEWPMGKDGFISYLTAKPLVTSG